MKHFGHIIADIRKARGLTQTDLAKKVGVSRRMISYMENDNRGRIEILWRCVLVLEIQAMLFEYQLSAEKWRKYQRLSGGNQMPKHTP